MTLFEQNMRKLRDEENAFLLDFDKALFQSEHGRGADSADELLRSSPKGLPKAVQKAIQPVPDSTLKNSASPIP